MISFYVLDGQAENTPALLGGRELWNRLAVVAYCGEYFAHRDVDGVWWTNTLHRLRGRHVAIDLSEDPQRLRTTLERLQRPPEPGDDYDEGNDDDGGGDDGHGRRVSRRSASRSRDGHLPTGFGAEVHGVVRQAAISATGGLDGDRDVRDGDGDAPMTGASDAAGFVGLGTTSLSMPHYIDLDVDTPNTSEELHGCRTMPAVLVSSSCGGCASSCTFPVRCALVWRTTM
eukprot:s332_g35.t1